MWTWMDQFYKRSKLHFIFIHFMPFLLLLLWYCYSQLFWTFIYWYIVDVQFYVSYRCTAYCDSQFLKVILHSVILKYWLYFLCCTIYLVAYLLYTQQFIPLYPLLFLAPPPFLLPLVVTNLFSVSVSHVFL